MRNLAIVAFVLLAACGSGGGGGNTVPPTCAELARSFTACGGDIARPWKLRGFCMNGTITGKDILDPPACADTAIAAVGKDPGGTVTFAAGGTYTADFQATMALTLDLQGACLEALADGSGDPSGLCAQLDSSGMSCQYAAPVCRCQTTQALTLQGTGHYQAQDGHLLLTGDKPASMDYCIADGTMTVRAPVAQGSPGSQVFVFDPG